MYRPWVYRGFAILLSWVLASCTIANPQRPSSTAASPDALTQLKSSPNDSKEAVQNVVSLTSLYADIIYRLDKKKLVGMPGSRLFNQDKKFDKIPRISQGQSLPNLERIVALKPDLVVGSTGIHEATAQKLKQLGIATSLYYIDSWEQLELVTKTLAKSINADPEPLLKKYKTILENKQTSSPSALILVSRQPILAPNKNSWAGDILAKFNVKNLAAELQGESPARGYISLSAEKIIQADPEVLIVVDNGDKILDQYKSLPFWSKLKAVKNNRVYAFDYFGLVNPGSIDAIEQTTTKLKQVLSEKKQGS